MQDTYKAVEVSAPGTLRLVERPLKEPGAGQVRIRVEACGVCHSDAATVTGAWPGLTLPRVPGHEVVGRIDALAVEAHARCRPGAVAAVLSTTKLLGPLLSKIRATGVPLATGTPPTGPTGDVPSASARRRSSYATC